MIRSATSIEAEGIQRPHANTSQVISFLLLLLFKFYCSFSIQATLHPDEPWPGVCGRTLVLMSAEEGSGAGRADLRTLGTEQKLGPVSRRRDHARAEPHTAGRQPQGRNHSRQTGFQLQSCTFRRCGRFCRPRSPGQTPRPSVGEPHAGGIPFPPAVYPSALWSKGLKTMSNVYTHKYRNAVYSLCPCG